MTIAPNSSATKSPGGISLIKRWMPVVALAALLAAPAAPRAEDEPTSNGPALFKDHGCAGCHSIGGISTGGGPELTQVGWRRSQDWLVRFIQSPGKFLDEPGMPAGTSLDTMELVGLTNYLLSVRKPIPAAHARDGAKLFEDYQCGSCHALGGKGGKEEFPDLAGVGARRTARELGAWLKNPGAVKKGTFMPAFKLKPAELKSLVRYLATLK